MELISVPISETAAATSVAATAVTAATSTAVAAATAESASSAAASSPSEGSAFLFIGFAGDVVFSVNFGCDWLFCGFEFAIFADVQAHITFKEGDVAVFNAYRFAFVDFFDVIIPECEVHCSCLVAD